MATDSSIERVWEFAGRRWSLGESPRFMGILNVTSDSFSDGGQWVAVEQAVEHGLRLVSEGADVLDIGGESTRPGATPVPVEEELKRVVPVIEQLARQTDVPISIDTMKAEVAQAALQAGASIVNDISGLLFDPQLIDVCARENCGVVLMHMQGTPQTMQLNPHYDDVVPEIASWLNARLKWVVERGVAAERVVLDPGVGFGKTAQYNLEILRNVAAFRALGRPVLVGHSRKRFLKKLIGREVDERLAGTVGVAIALAQQNCDLIRVHDVSAVRDAVTAWQAVMHRGETSVNLDENREFRG